MGGLTGRRIVTTRDRPGRLEQLLETAGATVVHVPLIEIAEPDDGGTALRGALDRLDDASWLVVTSAHGAHRVATAARRHPEVRLAAVGTRTARELADGAARRVDVVPERQTGADLVAAMPPPSGRERVVVAQADRAAPTVATGLAELGYEVEAVTAYRTLLRHPEPDERSAALEADAVAFASGSAARAWVEAVGTAAPGVVVAIGPTTAAAARDAGLRVTHVAADHTVEGLAAEIAAALGPRP